MKTALSRTLLGIFLIGFSQITKAGTTILLTDNFDAGGSGDFTSFNNANATTQTGALAPMNYQVVVPSAPNNDFWRIQHSNSGQLLSLPESSAGSSWNFATSADALNKPLEISFNINVGDWGGTSDPMQWAQFNIGKSANLDPLNSNVLFAALFRLNGNTSLLGTSGGSGPNWTANDKVTFLFSDTNGGGSPFNGNGSRVAVTIGSTTMNYTMNQMDAGYITFSGYSYGINGGMAQVDNLSVALLPEPSAVSLLAVGLGGLALIRRRRS